MIIMTIVMTNLFSIVTSTLATFIITKQMLGESTGCPLHGPGVLDLDELKGRALGLVEGLHHHHHGVRLEKSAEDRVDEGVGKPLQKGLGETQTATIYICIEGNTRKNKTLTYEMSNMWAE